LYTKQKGHHIDDPFLTNPMIYLRILVFQF